MPDSPDSSPTLTPYDPLNPTATPPSTMRNIMARYHADIGQQVDYTLADLQARWAPVRAALDQEIRRLTQQMEQALAHGDTLSESWLNEAQRLTQLKGLVEGNVAEFAAAARSGIGAAQLQAIQSGTEAAQAALAGVVPPGVNYTFGVPPDAVLHQLAGATQPYSPLSALFDEFGPQASQQAAQALFTSVALGESPRVAAERLQWATDMPARRAEMIARTEIARSWRGAQLANYRANSDVVQQWEWLADWGPRTCGACAAMDGTFHPLEEELDDHICGRCSAAPITRPWSEILSDAGVPPEQLPPELAAADAVAAAGRPVGQTAADWLARQSVETQNLVLGPAKAEAWRQGAFQLTDLVGMRTDPIWGSSIQELSLRQMGLDAQSWLTAAREGGSGSMLAEDAALTQAHSESFATQADTLAQAKAAADEWYAQIERSIAGSGASPERLAEVQAQAADWYAQVERSIARGDTAGVLDYSNPDSMWGIRREEAIAVAEGRAEFLSARPAASEATAAETAVTETAVTETAVTETAVTETAVTETAVTETPLDMSINPDVKFISEQDVAAWTADNAERVPDIGYHATTPDGLQSILENGVDVSRSDVPIYGAGFYMYDVPNGPYAQGIEAYHPGATEMVRVAVHMEHPYMMNLWDNGLGRAVHDMYEAHPDWRNAPGVEAPGTNGFKIDAYQYQLPVYLREQGYDGIIAYGGDVAAGYHDEIIAIEPGSVRVIDDAQAIAEAQTQAHALKEPPTHGQ